MDIVFIIAGLLIAFVIIVTAVDMWQNKKLRDQAHKQDPDQ